MSQMLPILGGRKLDLALPPKKTVLPSGETSVIRLGDPAARRFTGPFLADPSLRRSAALKALRTTSRQRPVWHRGRPRAPPQAPSPGKARQLGKEQPRTSPIRTGLSTLFVILPARATCTDQPETPTIVGGFLGDQIETAGNEAAGRQRTRSFALAPKRRPQPPGRSKGVAVRPERSRFGRETIGIPSAATAKRQEATTTNDENGGIDG